MLYKETKQTTIALKREKKRTEEIMGSAQNRPQPRNRLFPTLGFLGERKHALSARALGFQDERSGTKF